MYMSLKIRSLLFVSAAALLLLTACAGHRYAVNDSPSAYLKIRCGEGLCMTFEKYASSLPKHAVRVGFDIDDTLLFSSPTKQFREMQIVKCVNGDNSRLELCTKKVDSYLGKAATLCENMPFQPSESPYNCFDDFSLPKLIGRALLILHQARGDSIYVISARGKVADTTESPDVDEASVADTLNRAFALNHKPLTSADVILSGQPDNKHFHITELNLDYYYGDADTDMIEAVASGSRPVRILRSKSSVTQTPAHPGVYGEIVILGSEY